MRLNKTNKKKKRMIRDPSESHLSSQGTSLLTGLASSDLLTGKHPKGERGCN